MPKIDRLHRPLCALLVCVVACQEDVDTRTNASATDDDDAIPDPPTDPTEGDPTGGGINPKEFCQLNPLEDFDGFNYVCSGHIRGGMGFDYYGDPDIEIDKYLPCFQKPDPQPEGYRFTCAFELINAPFSPENEQPNGHLIDACCLPDSPAEAVEPYCRVDAAEEFCLQGSEQFNDFRKKIPVIPKLEQVSLQLENLNKFIADSSTQTDCAQTYTKGLHEALDFEDDLSVLWNVESPQQLDPEVGWPWFRNIITGIDTFKIDSNENSGVSCSQVGDALTGGALTGGTLAVESFLGRAVVAVTGGSFALWRSECRLDSCELRFETLAVELEDFAIGPLEFSAVSASLIAPASGLLDGTAIGVPEGRMHFDVRFRLAIAGKPAFYGASLSARFSNHGVAEARLTSGPRFGVQKIEATNWPFDVRLMTDLAGCD